MLGMRCSECSSRATAGVARGAGGGAAISADPAAACPLPPPAPAAPRPPRTCRPAERSRRRRGHGGAARTQRCCRLPHIGSERDVDRDYHGAALRDCATRTRTHVQASAMCELYRTNKHMFVPQGPSTTTRSLHSF
ncbi:hypothetical protein O0L34_g8421 [Tuta absoluta]|nr:hypothetical protein O0L34_g8421 [Tuta absoluta]